MSNAPGMLDAVSIITARLENMNQNMSTVDYCDLVVAILSEEDHFIITSAIASLAVASLKIASGDKGIPPEELLQLMAMTLQN